MSTVARLEINSVNTSQWTTRLDVPITLQGYNLGVYQVGLVSLSTPYSFANVTAFASNNKLHYNNGVTDKVITFPDGIYDTAGINAYILSVMVTNGDSYLIGSTPTSPVILIANETRGIFQIDIYTAFTVDFTQASTIGSLIGFNLAKTAGISDEDFESDITDYQSKVTLECSIVSNSYQDGALSQNIYTFIPIENPFKIIVREPSNPIYLPVNTDTIRNIQWRLVGTDGRTVRNLDNNISLTIDIKKV